MGCGGLLGVDAGSAEEPRRLLAPRVISPSGSKGIMYDAGAWP